jgi:hypothetical protein
MDTCNSDVFEQKDEKEVVEAMTQGSSDERMREQPLQDGKWQGATGLKEPVCPPTLQKDRREERTTETLSPIRRGHNSQKRCSSNSRC